MCIDRDKEAIVDARGAVDDQGGMGQGGLVQQ